MKRPLLLLPLLALAAVPCLAQDPATNAPAAKRADIAVGFSEAEAAAMLSAYARIERTICERISESASPAIVSNVFAVYGAGYIHSSNAIPILFERIAAKGMDEPGRLYSDTTPWDEPEEPTNGEVRLVSFNRSIYPKPPTPAVGALTQMPVTLDALERAISSDDAEGRARELFAWVAAAKFGSSFFDWLDDEFKANPDKWRSHKEFADKRLIGRKPFAMDLYGPILKRALGKDIWQYDQMVETLRKRGEEAKERDDADSLRRIVHCLETMGKPLKKPLLRQYLESIEVVNDR